MHRDETILNGITLCERFTSEPFAAHSPDSFKEI